MNKKEVSEIRRHLTTDRANIKHIYGCYANYGEKQIISQFELSAGLMSETESDMYLGLLKKAISGNVQKNLVSVVMENDSPKKGLLKKLWEDELSDADKREELFRTIIDNVIFEKADNFLILLAMDQHDVLNPSEDAYGEFESEGCVRYYICAVCPVKDASAELAYISDNKEFHTNTLGQTAQAPVIGFMYPSVEQGAIRLEKALYYMKKPADPHDEIVAALFGEQRPKNDAERQEAFRESLIGATDGPCDFVVAQNLFQSMRDKEVELKESETPELVAMKPEDVRDLLESSGMDNEQADDFLESYRPAVGKDIRMLPSAIMDNDKMTIANDKVKIIADPDISYRIHMRTVDGTKYVLVPVDEGVTLNGIDVT